MDLFGVDLPDKDRGARRYMMFMHECNNGDMEAFNQLEVRTNRFVFLDYNPTHEFWVHTELLNRPSFDTGFVKVTYKDNEALNEQIIKSIESRKHNEYWWRVYGEGEIGILEGAIFKNWREGAFNDHLAYSYGLDFGFHPDPTALIKIAIDNKHKKIYARELCYAQELSQQQIIDVIENNIVRDEMVIADSADSRLIDAIAEQGFNVTGAEKGSGSVRAGILFLQDYEIVIDPESKNLIKEFQNYCWNDKRAGIPIDKYNHLIDAMRYACEKLRLPEFYFG